MKELISKIINRLKKLKWLAVILALVIVGGYFLNQSQAKKKESQYQTYTVSKTELISSVSASGEISGEEKVNLRFQASGQLAWVGVKEGDWVEKWQAIASLDRRALEKTLKQELYDYENTRYNIDEERKTNSVSSNQFDHFYMSDDVKFDLLRSQNTLDRSVIDVEISDIALKYATIFTPIEGIVTLVESPYAGVNITPASADFEVVNPNGLIFEANIDEVDIAKIDIGGKADIVLDAFPDDKFEGEIIFIGFNSTVTSGGGTAFPIKIKPSWTDKLRIGMNGDVEIIIDQISDILTVPFEAVHEKEGKQYVYVLEDKKPVEKEVVLGSTNDTNYEISSGLSDGEQVIISGIKNTFQ